MALAGYETGKQDVAGAGQPFPAVSGKIPGRTVRRLPAVPCRDGDIRLLERAVFAGVQRYLPEMAGFVTQPCRAVGGVEQGNDVGIDVSDGIDGIDAGPVGIGHVFGGFVAGSEAPA